MEVTEKNIDFTSLCDKYADELFGMSDSGALHALGTARACYMLAREVLGYNIDEARKLFVMGLLHDFAYEFEPVGMTHAEVGADILDGLKFPYADEIRKHEVLVEDEVNSDAMDILYCADMTTDYLGRFVTFDERLADIDRRHDSSDGVYDASLVLVNYLISKGYRC